MRGVTCRSGFEHLCRVQFQLTRLMRGVTFAVAVAFYSYGISTHTPHARRDSFTAAIYRLLMRFQLTRLMRGVTPQNNDNCTSSSTFQLTRLMRGVTGT